MFPEIQSQCSNLQLKCNGSTIVLQCVKIVLVRLLKMSGSWKLEDLSVYIYVSFFKGNEYTR